MNFKTTASRFIALTSALLLGACVDAPTAVEPLSSAALSRGAAGDRIADLFAKASPAVMALGGTVFADNDERIGKMVFGVQNAIPGVTRALAAIGAPGEVLELSHDWYQRSQRGDPVPAGRYTIRGSDPHRGAHDAGIPARYSRDNLSLAHKKIPGGFAGDSFCWLPSRS